MSVMVLIVVLFFLYAGLFLFFGGMYINRRHPTVTKFFLIRHTLQNWQIHPTLLPSPIELASLCNKEFMEVSPTSTLVNDVDFRHRNIGDIVDIVHFRARTLRKTIFEMRVYAFIVLALGSVGFLRFLNENEFKPELFPFLKWMDTHPLELIALLEGIMLGALTIRLAVELMTISELIEEDFPKHIAVQQSSSQQPHVPQFPSSIPQQEGISGSEQEYSETSQ